MTDIDPWITASFVAGFIPAMILVCLYGFRTRWTHTIEGRALFFAFLVVAGSYLISLLVLLLPEVFRHGTGLWVRNGSRFALAGVLWNMLRIFLRAQRDGRRRDDV